MTKSLEERLDLIQTEIKKPSFRANKGLGNEVGYYVFDYPAEEELRVREHVKYMKRKKLYKELQSLMTKQSPEKPT